MNIKRALGALLAGFLFLSTGFVSQAMAPPLPEKHLRVQRSDAQAIVLEFTVEDWSIETVAHEGRTYHRLLIPDTMQTDTPGAPQVPTRGTLLGLPTTQGVRVGIIEADYQTLRGYHLLPAPGIKVVDEDTGTPPAGTVEQFFTLDQGLYATDAFYPSRPVALGDTGYLRDQAVAQVRFNPVQYNPVTGEVRLYRRILAQVTWTPLLPTQLSPARSTSPAFENVLRQTLLNYPALDRPVPPNQVSPIAPRASDTVAATLATTTLKIGVTEAGLYELTHGDLTGAGLNLSGVDPRTIKISHRGTEIPIYVDGEEDGAFDDTDTLLFYGTGIDDLYTSENVYWLTVGGANGQRMTTRDTTPAGGTVPVHFPVTVHVEEDTYYWQSMPNGEGKDHWFWGDRLTASATRTYTVTLGHVSTAATTTTVRVRLQGRTDMKSTISPPPPDHHTRIHINGHEVDDALWDGQVVYDHEAATFHSYLEEGQNVITVESVKIADVVVDQIHVNWITIEYWDTYVAENDELLFGAPVTDTFQFEVTQFSGSDVRAFDVTDPAQATILTGTIVVPDAGTYTLRFEDAAQPDTRYLALRPGQYKSPAWIRPDQPSSWKSPTNGADYVIVTHEDFYTSCLELADHRQNISGLRVATVKVEDVYDEFNDGIFSPQAIRDFLSYAYQDWVAPAPTFVLLVGDATYDYKDNLGTGTVNYVPSQIIETDQLGQTSSDNWFVLVSGADILPDMLLGRLSAQEVAQVDDIVDKIIYYEQHPPDGTWNGNALLVADDRQYPSDDDFEGISEEIADMLPDDYVLQRVYVADYPPGDPTADIADSIDSGSILVNYIGHGHVDGWGKWDGSNDIFELADITGLNNTHQLPVVTAANCLNGYFTGAKTEISAAEAFVRLKDRGAVAVWASTGLGRASGHEVLMEEFYAAIFQDGAHVLGTATHAAKIAAYGQGSSANELIQTLLLFGDPATVFYHPYVESTAPADGAGNVPIDQEIQIAFSTALSTTTVTLSGEGTLGLPLTPTWSAGDTVVTYAHSGFDYGRTLTFTVSGQDQHGTPLGTGVVPSTWAFTVTNDDVPPDGTIGVEGGTLADVPLTAAVIITFTEPMRTNSVAYTSVPPVAGSLSWDASGEVARFDHVRFEPATYYTFTVTAAKDVGGNPLPGPLELGFITQEVYPTYLPFVVKAFPAP